MKQRFRHIFKLSLMFAIFALLFSGAVQSKGKNKSKLKLLNFLTKLKTSKYVKVKHAKAKKGGTVRCDTKFKATRKLDKAFLHVYNLTCWSCPKGYKRSLDPNVAGGKACLKPAYSKWSKSKYRGKGKKVLVVGVKCPGGTFRHGLTDKCYSCPRGYKRTVFGISSKKACEKVVRARFTKATKRGKTGCKKGYFQHGLTNRCYQCPKGYRRSLVITKDPSKHRKACEQIKITPPPAMKKRMDAMRAKMKKFFQGKNGRTVKRAVAKMRKLKLSKRYALMSKSQKRKELLRLLKESRIMQLMSPLLRKNIRSTGTKANGMACSNNNQCESGLCKDSSCWETDEFKSFTISVAIDLGFALSVEGAITLGIKSPWSSRGSTAPKSYLEFYIGAGATVGVDVALDFGFFRDTNDALSGQLMGLTIAGAYIGGVAVSLWWRCPYMETCFFGTKNPNAGQFVGFQVGPQAGIGVEVEYGIVTSWEHDL